MMKAFTLVSLFVASGWALWPLPNSSETGDKALWIAENVKVSYVGPGTVRSITITIG